MEIRCKLIIYSKQKLFTARIHCITMAVPITIITGFLGSGKTTLLQNLLRKSTKKIAILMNEFGAVDIDAKIIKGKNVNVIELAGGCVCCSLAGEFEVAIKEILKKYNPDQIVIETTGV